MHIHRYSLALVALTVLSLPGRGHAWSSAPSVSAHVEHRATGRVTGVADGDTLYVDINGKSTRIRLAEIDAPEKSQAYGRRSEQSLRELVGKSQVALTWRDIDPYGRPVVKVQVDGLDVNAEQVKRGYAWVYRQYSHDANLIALEANAKAAGLGLWADPHPVAPWEWRHAQKER